MSLDILTCEQGSAEWFAARMGIPTASEFHTIVGIKKDAREKLTRQTYMRKLAGEILTGEPMESYQNANMERGQMLEAAARAMYGLMQDCEPEQVGFIRFGDTGCSPDSLIGENGGLEIKCVLAHTQIERLERNELPPQYRFQVQGSLWIAQREFWDFVSYCPHLPIFTVRVMRDEKCIKEIAAAVDAFNSELQDMVARIRRYGSAAKAA